MSSISTSQNAANHDRGRNLENAAPLDTPSSKSAYSFESAQRDLAKALPFTNPQELGDYTAKYLPSARLGQSISDGYERIFRKLASTGTKLSDFQKLAEGLDALLKSESSQNGETLRAIDSARRHAEALASTDPKDRLAVVSNIAFLWQKIDIIVENDLAQRSAAA